MGFQIYQNDFRDAFQKLEPESVKAIITSPPYKRADGFSSQLIMDLAREAFRVLRSDGILALNFGQLAEDPSRHHWVALECAQKLIPGPEIFWIKSLPEYGGHFAPLPGDKWLNRKWEWVFIFGKKNYAMDRFREGVGIPYIYKSNSKRFAHGRDLQCPGDVWYIPHETIGNKKRPHPHQWPLKLPEKLIRLSGAVSGDLICDPFMGSGATAKATLRVNKMLSFFGCEIDPTRFQCALDELEYSV